MGLGAFPGDDPLSLSFLGMHGTVYANYAVDNCDLLLAFGVRFDDRVTGKVSEFAARSTIVHIDVDPSEINKIKKVQLPICSDVKYALAELNKIVQPPADLGEWHRKIDVWKKADPLDYDRDFDGILPQHALDLTWQLTQGPRHDRLHGRGPAPDVGGPVLQVPPAAPLALQPWAGHDGLRPARRDGRPRPPIPRPW